MPLQHFSPSSATFTGIDGRSEPGLACTLNIGVPGVKDCQFSTDLIGKSAYNAQEYCHLVPCQSLHFIALWSLCIRRRHLVLARRPSHGTSFRSRSLRLFVSCLQTVDVIAIDVYRRHPQKFSESRRLLRNLAWQHISQSLRPSRPLQRSIFTNEVEVEDISLRA